MEFGVTIWIRCLRENNMEQEVQFRFLDKLTLFAKYTVVIIHD